VYKVDPLTNNILPDE